MIESTRLAELAGLMADPTRAEILLTLMDGRAFCASELASIANIGAPTASHHLKALLDSDLITVVQQGRHRYFRLNGPDVSGMLEGMLLLGEPKHGRPRMSTQQKPLATARSCYNHLGGRTAILIWKSLEQRSLICVDSDRVVLTENGEGRLAAIGIETHGLRGKACLDWTERRPHLSGPLGAAVLDHLLKAKWLERTDTPRRLVATNAGKTELRRNFPVENPSEWDRCFDPGVGFC